jgi:hypothetical protein
MGSNTCKVCTYASQSNVRCILSSIESCKCISITSTTQHWSSHCGHSGHVLPVMNQTHMTEIYAWVTMYCTCCWKCLSGLAGMESLRACCEHVNYQHATRFAQYCAQTTRNKKSLLNARGRVVTPCMQVMMDSLSSAWC